MSAVVPSDCHQPLEPMHDWARALWPICRSLSGDGVRETLAFLKNLLPDLEIQSIASGTRVFDWVVPDEWNISQGQLTFETGERIVDFAINNLHVVGYSEPVDAVLSLEDLQPHLHSRPAQPTAIPYVTSYYERRWGFCLTHERRQGLKPGRYHANIRSTLQPGVLNYGELILPGREKSEILLSTYVCHPSMANNELSGPVVTTALARWLMGMKDRRHTYRIVFVPETIGSLIYLSRHLAEMQRHLIAGYVITCAGDERTYSFMPTLSGNTLADRAAVHALRQSVGHFDSYSFLERGSDERQYCAPRVGLPVASIMRSKYGTYPEYHTSLDDLTLMTQKGLEGAFNVYKRCLSCLEANVVYGSASIGEPQFSRRGLMPRVGTTESDKEFRAMLNLVAYADGKRDLIAIADAIGEDATQLAPLARRLLEAGVLERLDAVRLAFAQDRS